jgi:hypothetical protein
MVVVDDVRGYGTTYVRMLLIPSPSPIPYILCQQIVLYAVNCQEGNLDWHVENVLQKAIHSFGSGTLRFILHQLLPLYLCILGKDFALGMCGSSGTLRFL